MTDSELADALRLAEEIVELDSQRRDHADWTDRTELARALLALHERVEKAETVCECVDGSIPCDIVGEDTVRALEAWRKAKRLTRQPQ